MNYNLNQKPQRLTMLLVVLLMAFNAKATYTLTDADVEMDANGYIISCSYSFIDKDIIIPETLDGYAVKGIGDDYNNLFYDKDIVSIQFPSGIEYIGRYAFASNELVSITIPNNITSIEERAFSSNLFTSITIPNNVSSIGKNSFAYNKLTSITIPSSVEFIEEGAFRSNKITGITLSSGVISIGKWAFYRNQLTNVTIPNSVSFIGEDAFGLNDLTSFVLPTLTVTGFVDWLDSNGNHYDGGTAVTDLGTNYRARFPYTLTDADVEMDVNGYIISCLYSFEASMITIPESLDGYAVKGIGDDYRNLFNEKNITSIQLPSGLEYIGTYAFSSNYLTSVTIPNGVTLIGEEAFSHNLLTNITIPNSVTSIGNTAFGSNKLTNVTISSSVTSISDNVFNYNQLSSIIIPNGVTSVGSGAFSNNRLSSVTIPNSVTSIGSEAFSVNQLSSVTIPNSVIYIGDGAFSNNQLTGFMLPTPTVTGFIDWVDSNGDHYDAGTTVTDLSVFYRARVPYILKDEDVEMDANGYILSCSYDFTLKDILIPETLDGYVVKGIGDDYKNLFYYKEITSIQFPSGLEIIGRNAFASNLLRSIEFPTSVTSIGYGAFTGNQLTSIVFPNSIKFIGSYAFNGNKLTSITLPNDIASIEDWVFYRNQLTSVVIPNSVISIGVQSFGKNKLASIDIPNSVTYIKANAFYDNLITSFILPTPTLTGFINWLDGDGNYYEGGAEITEELTPYYRARTPYTITDDDVEMNADGFIISCSYGFSASLITIPETLDGIAVKGIANGSWNAGVFYEKAIVSVQLPSGLENIGNNAFSKNLLSTIDIPENVTYIGFMAFSANELTSLVIPDRVNDIGAYAFASNQIPSVVIPRSITHISPGMFSNNKLTSIIIPTSVIGIGEHAFATNLLSGFVLPEAEKEGYTFDNWNGSIPANTEVTDFSATYTAYFTLVTGIENVDEVNVMVYPNPTKGFVTIKVDGNYSVEVMSLSGVLIQKLHVTGSNCTIDLSSLDSGIYLLRFAGEYGTYVKRVVKE